jgi:hypothetical protein
MATEKQARKARDQYFDYLSGLGAHTLAVDTPDKAHKDKFAIVAFVEDEKAGLPEEVEIDHNGKKMKVPVVIEQSEKFKPQ